MKKILSLLIAIVLTLGIAIGQSDINITQKQKEDGYKVDVVLHDKTMSSADRASYESKLDNISLSIQDVETNITEIKGVVETIAIDKNNANLVYLAEEYGLSKKDIQKAVARSKLNGVIASIIPFCILLFLWIRMYNFKEIRGDTYAILAIISLLTAVLSYFVINGCLEYFNKDMSTLRELEKLL